VLAAWQLWFHHLVSGLCAVSGISSSAIGLPHSAGFQWNGTVPQKPMSNDNRKRLQRATDFVLLSLRNGECNKYTQDPSD
jgi:hypothetical protein